MRNDATLQAFPELPLDAAVIIDAIGKRNRRVLLFGAMGTGKSTLAAQLAATLSLHQRSCWCLNTDPGSPAFGPPGCVSVARWTQDAWEVVDYAALCTLDAGRFRLPLVTAVRTLAKQLPGETALIDLPGVVRGASGRELLPALFEATAADTVLAMVTAGKAPPLQDELHSLAADVYLVNAAPEAKQPKSVPGQVNKSPCYKPGAPQP